jgi:hypothetical protein
MVNQDYLKNGLFFMEIRSEFFKQYILNIMKTIYNLFLIAILIVSLNSCTSPKKNISNQDVDKEVEEIIKKNKQEIENIQNQ